MNKKELLAIALILSSFALTAFFYDSLPQRIAIHWNAQGVADGSGDKNFAAFITPVAALFAFLIFQAIPLLDPLKKNIEKFKGVFDEFKVVLVAFLLLVHLGTLAFNLGGAFDFKFIVIPGIAGLFFFTGRLMEKAKRNWFIGIRTPWTLSSDKVWDKTHKVAAKAFKTASVLSLLSLFAGKNAVFFAIIPITLAALVPFVYSYFEYQKEKNK
ncbi:MAG: SdpI family protein [Candidatus Micrarchaeia archaeon]